MLWVAQVRSYGAARITNSIAFCLKYKDVQLIYVFDEASLVGDSKIGILVHGKVRPTTFKLFNIVFQFLFEIKLVLLLILCSTIT